MRVAAHLVDNVLTLAPYRQMVLSFPIPLRYWIHTNKKLFSKIHSIVIKEMHCYYINKAKLNGIKNPYPGSREGYLDKDGEVVQNPMMDELFRESEAITAAAYASIAGKIAFG